MRTAQANISLDAEKGDDMDLHEKLCGCYLGKNVGGTLGMPHEGVETFMDLDYYQPVPDKPAPNDDIDLQLVWLEAFKEKGVGLSAADLASRWQRHIDAHFDEYGIALWNLRRGLQPPLSGIHNNFFTNGLGAAIRSEIWASLFPGQPLTAAYYAQLDASVDHWGDGVYAEMFLAAAQSHLYTSDSLRGSIDYAMKLLPDSSKLKEALTDTINSFDSGMPYADARDRVMRLYGNVNFTDCAMNLSFVMLGLLYGKGDFSASILYAVNCGQDADCTGATAGAFLGILLGAKAIPEKWTSKVGDAIVVGDYIKDIKVNNSITGLVKDIEAHRPSAGALPEASAPFSLPQVEDKSDANAWLVEGERMLFDGFTLDSRRYSQLLGKEIHFKTQVSFRASGDIQLMVASRGLFRCAWNGRYIGVKGSMERPVPALHRVRGGRIFNLHVEKDVPCDLEICLYPTFPVPDMHVAFGDMANRHLDVKYLL